MDSSAWTIHSTASVRGGDEEVLAGDSGARPARHHAGETSFELGTQAVAMWRRKNSELKGQARGRRKANG
jgi:hypothetical protein